MDAMGTMHGSQFRTGGGVRKVVDQGGKRVGGGEGEREQTRGEGVIAAGLREAVGVPQDRRFGRHGDRDHGRGSQAPGNVECETQIIALSGATLSASDLAHFGIKGNTSLLKAFYHVRALF